MRHYRERMAHHRHTGRHEFVHWLYDPLSFGRMRYRVRVPWLHFHLIPGRWMDAACDRYDRRNHPAP
ncbi:hypothetical protein [Streptomyces sp. N35]|uniref:hypothetical protein n=1 Tax=Streptomyces sp. N35 TaxID=2795730 RepID=UPI0018F4103B|nr:hypothetical protein [Streptomyces sp. N35]